MHKNPLVVGLIPNYNYSQYIIDALDSLANQSYSDLKIFISDDNSTDDSLQKISEKIPTKTILVKNENVYLYKGEYLSREVYVLHNKKNYGRAGNRNNAINTIFKFIPEVKAIANCDSDDIYHPDKIKKSVDIMNTNPLEIGCVYSDYTSWHIEDNIKIREYKPPFNLQLLQQDCIANNDSLYNVLALQKIAHTNSQTQRVEYYREELTTAEDYLLHLLITKKMVYYHIPEDLLTVRAHKANSTFSVPKHEWERNWAKLRQILHESP